ncbi:MAG: class I SAM-dependent methyltransferase [Verrucomicrobia bacterium]|nr:class I SAM-dependent methyltransferase [Verrucomicrobiota bacterium]MBS0645406.1 class I SAM-dependent methyltransferase [Verrucomicrobiota bacterium]
MQPTVISEKDLGYLPFEQPACRFCGTTLQHTFCNLGVSPLSNAYLTSSQLQEKEHFYPLHVYVCSQCLLVQLPTLHTPDEIFSEYAYFSSYSSSWLEHAKAYVNMISKRFKLHEHSYVMELASNDGYLLQFFRQRNIPVLGIEPAKNVAQVARDKGIPTRSDFFGCELAKEYLGQVDLLIANNVLAHVPDLNDFVEGMKRVLKPQGVMTLEFPHLLRLMDENQFDTIYHEHFSYFSLLSVQRVFAAHGLMIFDVEQLPTHGGSLRIYVKHAEDLCKQQEPSVQKLIEEEKSKGLDMLETYLQFERQAQEVRADLLSFLQQAHQDNKTVIAYGAPAKGNTLLNYCGLNTKFLPFTVDKNTYKQGRFLPGTHIPIFSPSKILEIKPDYVLILPWNLKQEIMSEMEAVHQWGGRFVVPIPKLTLI